MPEDKKCLWLQIKRVNADQRYQFGDDEPFESRFYTKGAAYQDSLREYGRCRSKVYVDTVGGKAQAVGWVFVKREKYTDCEETYLCETWVTVLTGPPVKTIAYDYA